MESIKTYPIKPLKKLDYPRFMIFFDTETLQDKQDGKEKHNFRLGVAIYVELDKHFKQVNREVFHFNHIGDFWRYVYYKTKKDRVLYIFAHNVKYDLMSVQFEKGIKAIGFNPSFPVLGHNFILLANSGDRKIKILDSFNYVKVKLAHIGKAVGQGKIKLNEDLYNTLKFYTRPENKSNSTPIKRNRYKFRKISFNRISDKTLYAYCQNDVEIVEKFILKFIEFLHINKLGSLEATAASTAFNVFRTSFNNGVIHWHKDNDLLSFERSGYKGGRVECFFIGEKKSKFYLFDVNSMYPYVMANAELPVKPVLTTDTLSLSELEKYSQSHYCIADVELSYSHQIGQYGTHHDHKLLFPIGHFNATLHNPELIDAYQNNRILKIGKTVIYEKEKCLTEYANYFYNLKATATDITYYELSKLMNNSLYGRFGMRHYDKEILDYDFSDGDILGVVPIREINQDGKSVTRPYYKWYGKLIRSFHDETTPKKNTNIALAGAVTAYARMQLLKYISLAGIYSVYYCDTDSLLVDEKGAERLQPFIDSKELGKLKNEMECETIQINAPKDYLFGSKRRLKGIPSNYILNDGSYTFTQFTSLREYLRNQGSFYGTKEVSKKLTLEYNKGIIIPDGLYKGFTTPIILGV